jgi:DNA-binding transcriptional ArsR family regulator
VTDLPVSTADNAARCCPQLGQQPRLTPADAIELSRRLRALAEPSRISIVSLLAGRKDHALTTRELAPLVNLSEATVSHHLKLLAGAGLIHGHRDGARVQYRLDLDAVRAIAEVLDVCCPWEGPTAR